MNGRLAVRMAVATSIILAIGMNAAPANTKATTKTKKPAARTPQRIDPNLESVRAGYRGEPILEVFRIFAVPPKDEFEATAEYEARLAKLPFGTYAIELNDATIAYDADAGMMRVEITSELAYAEDPMKRQYEFKGDIEPTGTYVGQNAYGAKATIMTAHTSRVRLIDRNSTSDEPEKLSAEFAVPAIDARRLKPNLRALLLVEIDADAAKTVSYDRTRMSATVSSPYEFTVDEYQMSAAVLAFWIVDTSTGRIIYRSDAAETAKSS